MERSWSAFERISGENPERIQERKPQPSACQTKPCMADNKLSPTFTIDNIFRKFDCDLLAFSFLPLGRRFEKIQSEGDIYLLNHFYL